jgi:DNA topoisomerase-3
VVCVCFLFSLHIATPCHLPEFLFLLLFLAILTAVVVARAQAPPLLSEADLIQMMNRYGIGTDATIATHITTVQHREYAGMCANYYY